MCDLGTFPELAGLHISPDWMHRFRSARASSRSRKQGLRPDVRIQGEAGELQIPATKAGERASLLVALGAADMGLERGQMFKRAFLVILGSFFALTLGATAAFAGGPHFVGTPTKVISGNTATVSGKVAGLGNETQIHVDASAEVACLNPGENFPNANNKQSVGAGDDFPVQNGKANFELTLTAVFQPKCQPPMTLVFGPITITVSGDSFATFSTTIDP
jgi:hypothetical protein